MTNTVLVGIGIMLDLVTAGIFLWKTMPTPKELEIVQALLRQSRSAKIAISVLIVATVFMVGGLLL